MTPTGVVDRLYSDEEVAEIRSGSKRLYIFGTVTYEDVYRVRRYANSCFSCHLAERWQLYGHFYKTSQ